MENSRNRINVKLVNNKNDYLKCTSKQSYMSHNVFHNNLVVIHKSKLPLKLKKLHIGMCILELNKVLMYEFHCDYVKIKYDNNSTLLFASAGSWK